MWEQSSVFIANELSDKKHNIPEQKVVFHVFTFWNMIFFCLRSFIISSAELFSSFFSEVREHKHLVDMC